LTLPTVKHYSSCGLVCWFAVLFCHTPHRCAAPAHHLPAAFIPLVFACPPFSTCLLPPQPYGFLPRTPSSSTTGSFPHSTCFCRYRLAAATTHAHCSIAYAATLPTSSGSSAYHTHAHWREAKRAFWLAALLAAGSATARTHTYPTYHYLLPPRWLRTMTLVGLPHAVAMHAVWLLFLVFVRSRICRWFITLHLVPVRFWFSSLRFGSLAPGSVGVTHQNTATTPPPQPFLRFAATFAC